MAYFDNAYEGRTQPERAFLTAEAPLFKRIAVGAGVFSAIVGGTATLFAFSVTGGFDLVSGAQAQGPRETRALDGEQPRELDWARIEETVRAPGPRARVQRAAVEASDDSLAGAAPDPAYAAASWTAPAEEALPLIDEQEATENDWFPGETDEPSL